jgi:hypothetical protein
MLNFDMVGRLTSDKLLVYGTATAAELPALLDSANAAARRSVKGIGDGFGPSDHSSFYVKNVPVLHFFTDQHADYHAATDDRDALNYAGTARVVDLAHGVARAIADRPARLTFQRRRPRSGWRRAEQPGPAPVARLRPDMCRTACRAQAAGGHPDSPADKPASRRRRRRGDGRRAGTDPLHLHGRALRAEARDVLRVTVLRGAERVT